MLVIRCLCEPVSKRATAHILYIYFSAVRSFIACIWRTASGYWPGQRPSKTIYDMCFHAQFLYAGIFDGPYKFKSILHTQRTHIANERDCYDFWYMQSKNNFKKITARIVHIVVNVHHFRYASRSLNYFRINYILCNEIHEGISHT